MNNKNTTTLSCFATNKVDDEWNRENNRRHRIQISKSLHYNFNDLDTTSLASSTSSGQNITTPRPKPPPYEYTLGMYGIPRSYSNYTTYHNSSLCQDNASDKEESSDILSLQYSDGDPPQMTDNLSQLSNSGNFTRPMTFRPISPLKKRSNRHSIPLSKHGMESKQSPSGDSGVRLTPNDVDLSICSHDPEIHNSLQMSSDNDNIEELKILRLINTKLSLNEMNNQHLIIKATHLIGKLRQKMKDKDLEINNLKNKLKENTEMFRSQEQFCKQLQYLHLSIGSTCNSSHITFADRTTQTLNNSECINTDVQYLNTHFEKERTEWLEEKALVINYHKQFNENYNRLFQQNTQLQKELNMIQGKFIMETNCAFDTDRESDIVEGKESTTQTVSRLVKFEESLC